MEGLSKHYISDLWLCVDDDNCRGEGIKWDHRGVGGRGPLKEGGGAVNWGRHGTTNSLSICDLLASRRRRLQIKPAPVLIPPPNLVNC